MVHQRARAHPPNFTRIQPPTSPHPYRPSRLPCRVVCVRAFRPHAHFVSSIIELCVQRRLHTHTHTHTNECNLNLIWVELVLLVSIACKSLHTHTQQIDGTHTHTRAHIWFNVCELVNAATCIHFVLCCIRDATHLQKTERRFRSTLQFGCRTLGETHMGGLRRDWRSGSRWLHLLIIWMHLALSCMRTPLDLQPERLKREFNYCTKFVFQVCVLIQIYTVVYSECMGERF